MTDNKQIQSQSPSFKLEIPKSGVIYDKIQAKKRQSDEKIYNEQKKLIENGFASYDGGNQYIEFTHQFELRKEFKKQLISKGYSVSQTYDDEKSIYYIRITPHQCVEEQYPYFRCESGIPDMWGFHTPIFW